MIEFILGAMVGALAGYGARAWLSARRRRAARRARIAGSGEGGFVPFQLEKEKGNANEQGAATVVRLQPGGNDGGQPVEFRSRASSRSELNS